MLTSPQAAERWTQLPEFRRGFYQCLTAWGDALFELTDAVLCAPGPVGSVPSLSLEQIFRRSHGSTGDEAAPRSLRQPTSLRSCRQRSRIGL